MGGFFSFLVLLVIAYLVWRVTDQLPDLIFRLSEIQRDVAELRRNATAAEAPAQPAAPPPAAPSAPTPPPAAPPPAAAAPIEDDGA